MIDELENDTDAYQKAKLEMANKIYEIATSVLTSDGCFRRDIAADALFEAMMWMVSGSSLGESQEAYDYYLEYVHSQFHSCFEHGSNYGQLALTNEADDIIWDDIDEQWTTKASQQIEAKVAIKQ